MAAYLLEQQPCKLMLTIAYSLTVGGIDHPDERISLLEIILPVRAQRLLAADVPCVVSLCIPRIKQVWYICSICIFVISIPSS